MGEGIPPLNRPKGIPPIEPSERVRPKERGPREEPKPRKYPEKSDTEEDNRETEKPPVPPGQPGHKIDKLV